MFFKGLSSCLLILITLLHICSCSLTGTGNVNSSNAKLLIHESLNENKSFTFIVSDKFLKDSKSTPDKEYLNMSKSEAKLLKKLLKDNNYCINNKDVLLFEIISRQEKIYDVTFSGLIEQQYNAKSLTPVTYFGKCL
jgi:hypothetical protein